MTEQEQVICEYCNKKFSTVYNLTKHKKTAVYCLEIQKTRFNMDVIVDNYICEYCNQTCTSKLTYENHTNTCSLKKEADRVREIEQLKKDNDSLRLKITELSALKIIYEEKDRQLSKKEKEIEQLKQEYQYHLDKKEKEIDRIKHEKNEEIENIKHEKNEEIRQLKEQIKEKDEYIQNNPHTTIYQTTNNNSKYEFNFQAVFDKLVPFTEENVKERIISILPRQLIESNDYDVILNFCSNFGRKMADMAILTDKSRGLIFIKNKDGEKEKHQVKGFVNKCLVLGQPECIKLFNSTRNLVETYSLQEEIMPEDEAKCFGDLTILKEYFNTKTLDKTVRSISNILTDNCVYISKLLPGSLEHKMIEVMD